MLLSFMCFDGQNKHKFGVLTLMRAQYYIYMLAVKLKNRNREVKCSSLFMSRVENARAS